MKETLNKGMVCFESNEESMRNPNDVSILLCACLSKYREPTHSNLMKEKTFMSVLYAL